MEALQKKRLRQQEYREKNREVLRGKFKQYYEKNKEEINSRRRDTYLIKKYEGNVNVSNNRLHV